MPEVYFRIRWPDGSTDMCYSPSLVVKDYFEPRTSYPIAEFLKRSQAALLAASDRVQEKYGAQCSRALDQLHRIEITPSAGERCHRTRSKFCRSKNRGRHNVRAL